MKPIAEFVVQMDAAEKALKATVLAAFRAIDEAKVTFIEVYNAARVTMETDVAQREQTLRNTVAAAVEALNGEAAPESSGAPSEDTTSPTAMLPSPKLPSVTEDPTGLSA